MVVHRQAERLAAGPCCCATPGLATLLQAVSEDLFLTIFRADDILSQGIILKDIAKFLGSASGFDFIQNNAAVVHIQKREVAYLPFDCYCVPLFFERDSKAGAWAHAWALPHIDKSNVSEKVVPVRCSTRAQLRILRVEDGNLVGPRGLFDQL